MLTVIFTIRCLLGRKGIVNLQHTCQHSRLIEVIPKSKLVKEVGLDLGGLPKAGLPARPRGVRGHAPPGKSPSGAFSCILLLEQNFAVLRIKSIALCVFSCTTWAKTAHSNLYLIYGP